MQIDESTHFADASSESSSGGALLGHLGRELALAYGAAEAAPLPPKLQELVGLLYSVLNRDDDQSTD